MIIQGAIGLQKGRVHKCHTLRIWCTQAMPRPLSAILLLWFWNRTTYCLHMQLDKTFKANFFVSCQGPLSRNLSLEDFSDGISTAVFKYLGIDRVLTLHLRPLFPRLLP